MYLFENDDKLMSWAKKSISNARTSEITTGIVDKMEELSTLQNEIKKRGIENDSLAIDLLIAELYNTINTSSARTAVGVGFAAEHDYKQGEKLIMALFPQRHLYSFNDRISSYAIIGITIFFEHSKWKGAKYIADDGQDDVMGTSGWDNRVSSYQ